MLIHSRTIFFVVGRCVPSVHETGEAKLGLPRVTRRAPRELQVSASSCCDYPNQSRTHRLKEGKYKGRLVQEQTFGDTSSWYCLSTK
jgi:hypothetical protein